LAAVAAASRKAHADRPQATVARPGPPAECSMSTWARASTTLRAVQMDWKSAEKATARMTCTRGTTPRARSARVLLPWKASCHASGSVVCTACDISAVAPENMRRCLKLSRGVPRSSAAFCSRKAGRCSRKAARAAVPEARMVVRAVTGRARTATNLTSLQARQFAYQ
jgi:hypothetical protein